MDHDQAVDNGIAYLNDLNPQWFTVVDTTRLNLYWTDDCLLALLAEHGIGDGYDTFEATYGRSVAVEHGFVCDAPEYETLSCTCDELTGVWLRRILELKIDG